MAKWIRYLFGTSWTVRIAFMTLAMVLGLVAALVLWPHVADWLLLRDLASPDAAVRDKAMLRAEKAATATPKTLAHLNEALNTTDDSLFLTIASVLRNSGKLQTPDRPVELYDRLRAVELSRSSQSGIRELLSMEAVQAGRNNRYQRQALAAAAGDAEPIVRLVASTLAGQLRDDAVLGKLLADADPSVASAAAIDAAIAGRTALVPALAGLLETAKDSAVRGSAAYALAVLAPKDQAAKILALLTSTRDKVLREYLLHVATLLDGPPTAQAVLEVVAAQRKEGALPSPMALLACGKLKIAAAAPAVRDVLRTAAEARPDVSLTEPQVQAAIDAAARLDLGVRDELNDICRRLWGPNWPLMLMTAARELGRQIDKPQPATATRPAATRPAPTQPAAQPELEQTTPLQTLRLAAVYSAHPPTTQPDEVKPAVLATPLPSAAAAVALWLAQSPAAATRTATQATPPDLTLSDLFVGNAAFTETTLPGEYIAWHIGTSGRAGAYELGLAMLPPLGAPPTAHVYNDNERSAGAMLMALAARTPAQKAQAVERITSRLAGSATVGGEDSFYVAGSYKCALTILGQAQYKPDVLGLLELPDFPQRRTITALSVIGEKKALDWVLWNPQIPIEQIDFLLVDKGIREVIEAVAPRLPTIDLAAPNDVRLWQIQILRDTYILGRPGVAVGLTR